MISVLLALMLAQEKAVVEGTVLNAVTGEPIRKAEVTLGGQKKGYAAVSSGDGKFRLEGIEPGEYYPRAERQGFLDAYDEPSIAVAAGQELKNMVLKLTPQGIIAGHVVDEDGDPVPGAGVNVSRSIMVNGRRVRFEHDDETTNSEGYFFVDGLKAGPYYLSAEPPNDRRGENGAPREDYVFTEDPSAIRLAPGAALRNIEIRLRKSVVYRVRGQVSNAPDKRASLLLVSESGNFSFVSRIIDGAFSFESVPPGNYTIKSSPSLTRRADGTFVPPALFCHVAVTVADHDVDDVGVEFAPGPSVEGTLRIEGGGHFEKPPTLSISVAGREIDAVVKEDGMFEWTNLALLPHQILYRPPDGFYVKSTQFNHLPVKNWRIDLSSGVGGTIEIVAAPNAATLSAAVPGAKRVKLALWNNSISYIREVVPGVGTFSPLAPGEYRIAAWEKVDSEYLSIPEFRDRFDAQKITLTEGSHQSVEVKLIPKSVSDAEIAKLQ